MRYVHINSRKLTRERGKKIDIIICDRSHSNPHMSLRNMRFYASMNGRSVLKKNTIPWRYTGHCGFFFFSSHSIPSGNEMLCRVEKYEFGQLQSTSTNVFGFVIIFFGKVSFESLFSIFVLIFTPLDFHRWGLGAGSTLTNSQLKLASYVEPRITWESLSSRILVLFIPTSLQYPLPGQSSYLTLFIFIFLPPNK